MTVHAPIDEDAAITAVKAVMEEVGKNPQIVDGATKLDDLGLESLDMVEVFMRLERVAGAELNTDSLQGMERVGDLVELRPVKR